ncbi:MAG: hypothetical protein E6Q97_15870 [Desulfurellales bacterium]|nr:MAG: hypothetical protein E6Q97_15870 [Desulfurellales bacterium]
MGLKISPQDLNRILTQPGYSAPDWQRGKVKAAAWPSGPSKLEVKFDQLWALVEGPQLTGEHRFHPTRKWRFDRCHVGAMVAVEIQGRGRHQSERGYKADREKINEAQRLGWTVFELTGDQIGWPELERIRDFINSRLTHEKD